MPELPEIEIIKRSLFKMINKAKIMDTLKLIIKIYATKYHNTLFSKSLINEKILKISRRSKYLIFHFKNKVTFSSFRNDWKIFTYEKQR